MFPPSEHRDISFDAPQFTRLRHRYRGPRESEKVNLEVNQLYYSLRKLYEKYDTFQEDFVDRANIIFEGGETGVQDHLALKLDGVGTSHASIPDVNRLRAHLAHLTSVSLGTLTHDNGGVEEEWRARQVSGEIVADSSIPMGGKYIRSERLTTGWQTDWGVHHLVSASPGQTITFSAFTRAGPGANAQLGIMCLNAGGMSELTFSGPPTTNSSWTRVSATVTVPANTVSVRLLLQPGSGESYADFHSMCLRIDSSSVFVPSHRIAGNIDIRARFRAEALALTEWYPAQVVNRVVPAVTNTGLMRVYAASTTTWDGIGGINSTAPLPSPLSTQELRWVVVPNNGSGAWEASFYYRMNSSDDWTKLGGTRVGTPQFSIRNISGPVRAGIFNPNPNFATPSVYYSTEFRDGIDGVVVARFDVNSGWQDGDTAPASNFDAQGNEWTLHDKATVVAEVKHSMTEGLENLVKRLDALKRRVKVLEA